MERLTKRDSHGRAYFDNDGVLIRGANSAFHQKKDMTAHYIHDRLVALDKVIDQLAAYEDADLEPEEVQIVAEIFAGDPYVPILQASSLVKAYREGRVEILQPNDPLALEELEMMVGEPMYVIPAEKDPDWKPCWVICMEDYILVNSTTSESRAYILRRNEDYGKTWLAYRRKPEEETK